MFKDRKQTMVNIDHNTRRFSHNEIISKIEQNTNLNSDTLEFNRCYYLCANKNKFETLIHKDHQIVFGRRGTGKTTLFKAFTYHINNCYKERYCSCWYTRLDKFIPDEGEISNQSRQDVVVFCLQKFLIELADFFSNECDSLKKRKHYNIFQLNNILNKSIAFSDLVNNGSAKPVKTKKIESITEKRENKWGRGIGISFNFKKGRSIIEEIISFLKLEITRFSGKHKVIATMAEKQYVYKLDINEVKVYLDELIEAIGYETFYICIDEFSQIDRDIHQDLQPQIAQLIKQLLFKSPVISVKISSAWNKSRMQLREINGIRQGIEIGQDISANSNLNLDTMFEYDNEKASDFFKNYLLNMITINDDNYIGSNEENRKRFSNYLVEELFSSNSFQMLICGSHGIARLFVVLLNDCLVQMKNNDKKRISYSIIETVVLNHYLKDVRMAIEYTNPINKKIDNYVTEKKFRFFLVEIDQYINHRSVFDGLVQKCALHQCPSAQLPRQLRNEYKLFFVNYGNYIDSVKQQDAKSKSITTMIDFDEDIGFLFPKLPIDVEQNINRYLIDFSM